MPPLNDQGKGAALVALWFPPLWQQLTGEPGNLAALLSRSSEGPHRYGLGDGLRVSSMELAVPPQWAGRRYGIGVLATLDTTDLPLPWAAPLLIGGIVVAWRRRDRALLAGAAVLVVTMAAGVVAISRVTDVLFAYLIQWTIAVALVLWLWFAAVADRLRPPTWEANLRRGAAVLLALLAVAAAVTNRDVPVSDEAKSAMVREAAAAVVASVGPDASVVVTVPADNAAVQALWFVPSLLLVLESQGVDAASDVPLYQRPAPDEAVTVSVVGVGPDTTLADAPARPGEEAVYVGHSGDDVAVYISTGAP